MDRQTDRQTERVTQRCVSSDVTRLELSHKSCSLRSVLTETLLALLTFTWHRFLCIFVLEESNVRLFVQTPLQIFKSEREWRFD